MKKNKLIVVFGTIVCLLLSVFIVQKSVTADQPVSSDENPKKCFVTGMGIVKAEPDIAVFSCSITTQEKEASLSQEKNGEISQKVTEALLEKEIKEENIQTTSYSVNPVYVYKSGEEPKLIGYKTVHVLSIKILDIAQLGDIIDTAMNSGVNQIHGVQFDISNREEWQRKAIEAATNDARVKADTSLKPEGMGVVALQELRVVSSNAVTQAKRGYDGGAPEQLGTGPAIMPGTTSITAQVEAVFLFADCTEKEK